MKVMINQAVNYSGELNFNVRFALHNSCYILVQATLGSAGPRKKLIASFTSLLFSVGF